MKSKITKEDIIFVLVLVGAGLGMHYFVIPDSRIFQDWIEPGIIALGAVIYVRYLKKK